MKYVADLPVSFYFVMYLVGLSVCTTVGYIGFYSGFDTIVSWNIFYWSVVALFVATTILVKQICKLVGKVL